MPPQRPEPDSPQTDTPTVAAPLRGRGGPAGPPHITPFHLHPNLDPTVREATRPPRPQPDQRHPTTTKSEARTPVSATPQPNHEPHLPPHTHPHRSSPPPWARRPGRATPHPPHTPPNPHPSATG